jgi:hypothetical protein
VRLLWTPPAFDVGPRVASAATARLTGCCRWFASSTLDARAAHVGGAPARLGPSTLRMPPWLVFVEAVGPEILAHLFRRTRPQGEGLATLLHRIDAVLRVEPDITDLEWFNADWSTGSEAHHARVVNRTRSNAVSHVP